MIIVHVSGSFVGTYVCTPCPCVGHMTVSYVLLQIVAGYWESNTSICWKEQPVLLNAELSLQRPKEFSCQQMETLNRKWSYFRTLISMPMNTHRDMGVKFYQSYLNIFNFYFTLVISFLNFWIRGLKTTDILTCNLAHFHVICIF